MTPGQRGKAERETGTSEAVENNARVRKRRERKTKEGRQGGLTEPLLLLGHTTRSPELSVRVPSPPCLRLHQRH